MRKTTNNKTNNIAIMEDVKMENNIKKTQYDMVMANATPWQTACEGGKKRKF